MSKTLRLAATSFLFLGAAAATTILAQKAYGYADMKIDQVQTTYAEWNAARDRQAAQVLARKEAQALEKTCAATLKLWKGDASALPARCNEKSARADTIEGMPAPAALRPAKPVQDSALTGQRKPIVTASLAPAGNCFAHVEEAARLLPATSLAAGDPSPADILHGLIMVESSGNPRAVSSTGAKGCGQIVRKWHGDFYAANDPFDARANVEYSARYLASLVERHGTYFKAFRHYNGCVARNDCNQYAVDVWRAARARQKSNQQIASR